MQAGAMNIKLMADMADIQRKFNALEQMANNAVNKINGAFSGMGVKSAADAATKALGAMGGAFAIGGIVRLSDEFTKFNAQLKLATTGANSFAEAQRVVRAISTESQGDIAAIGSLYARIAQATAELGVSQRQVGDITRAVALSLRVSGATAQETASATLQLSQAFGAGVLRGEEFNAVNEAAPRLMQALADAIGRPRGELRAMAEQGLLTSKVLAFALPQALEKLEGEAAQIRTISGAVQVLRNEFMLFVGQSGSESGVVGLVASAIGLVAKNLNLLASAAIGFAALKLGGMFLGMAAGAKAWVIETYQAVTAQAALRAASIAEAQAKLANLSATQAAIVAIRADYVAKLASANASVVAATSESALTAAMNARSVAMATLANLGRQQAAVTAAQAAAQTALTGAMAATTGAAMLASRVIGVLGGPIGAITTLLGIGVTAWMAWGSQAEKSAEQASGAIAESHDEILARLDKQLQVLRERNRLQELGMDKFVQLETAEAQRLAKLQKEYDNLQNFGTPSGTGTRLPEAARLDLMRATMIQMAEILSLEQKINQEKERGEKFNLAKKLAQDMERYATDAERANSVIAKMRETYGSLFTPEMEKRVRAQIDANKSAAKSLEDYNNLRDKILGKQAGLDPDFYKQMQLLADGHKKYGVSLEETIALQEQYIQQQPFMQEQLKATAKEMDDYFKAEEDARLAQEKSIQTAREMLEAIEFETKALQMTNAEREIAIKLRELERAGLKAGSQEYEIYAQKIREAVVGQEAVRASLEAQQKAREDWTKTWEQIAQSFTDALMQGGKSVKEYLQSLFRTMLLRPLIQPIIAGGAGMMANVANAMGFGPGAAAGQGAGSGLLGSLGGATQAIAGGFAALGDSVAFAAENMGSWLVNNTSGVLNKMGGSLMESAGTLGTKVASSLSTAASYLGGAAVGFTLGKMISGSYSAFGSNSNTNVLAGTAIGAIFGGPIGAAIGGTIGGLVNRAFGREAAKTTDAGFSGTFSTQGADVRQYEDWLSKGGWFTSDASGTKYSSMNAELGQYLSTSLAQITQATRTYAHILGLNADAINGVTQSVKISLLGLNAEQQQQRIAQALGGFGDKLAEQLLGSYQTATTYTTKQIMQLRGGWDSELVPVLQTIAQTTTRWIAGPFVRAGETAGQALARLGNSLLAVNRVFDTLGQTLLQTSLVGGDAASRLLDAFGGADPFNKATTDYFQAYYSEAERAATTTRQLTEALAAMGLDLPKTREQYRALVESQDLYTESGRQTYVALLGLAPAFAQVTDAMQKMAASMADEVRRLRGLLTTDSGFAAAALQTQFATLTAQARAGDSAALERLPQISQALEDAAKASAATAADVARMRAWLAGSLSDTMAALGLSVPQFEVGTNYVPRDMLAMVHQGEAIVPKAYNPAAGVGGGEVAGEIRALRQEFATLRQEVALLRFEAQATATHTSKTARILDRVARDGETLSVSQA